MGARVNWSRLVAGGLVATLICFATDGLMHEKLVDADWRALGEALGLKPPEQQGHGAALISFLDFELGRGLGAIFIYVMMVARYGPGTKTAIGAALAAWLICSVSGPAQFIPLGFYSQTLWVKVAAVQLVTTTAATLAGAAIYRADRAPLGGEAR
jgi:hypothetical protein